jgi:hypothetical protein
MEGKKDPTTLAEFPLENLSSFLLIKALDNTSSNT